MASEIPICFERGEIYILHINPLSILYDILLKIRTFQDNKRLIFLHTDNTRSQCAVHLRLSFKRWNLENIIFYKVVKSVYKGRRGYTR